ncbi:uncharacterized protein SPSK_04754 [Sporothrix schenckii 1099-18]|uniref:Uncharacterized protein n=1 Tax=Sporothrix schenckii 1099-18 TaxID=1397361 RepID=A0A0F2M0B3_SPOSC|nr:uncharacterized protein SPSK_04754 [Sporothrix schenckii 1099-18]KJR83153.1 hypothetical protein SPSK_04754 [Sporothrix schenckii 1099-18]
MADRDKQNKYKQEIQQVSNRPGSLRPLCISMFFSVSCPASPVSGTLQSVATSTRLGRWRLPLYDDKDRYRSV